MINFRNDYCGIGHEKILDALIKYKNETYVGYGLDERSKNAELLIKKEIDNNSADIHFLPGGTICNKIVISHLLKPYEAVISADSGHINVHETGAIEEAGHKILSVNNINGKLTCEDILKVLDEHTNEHMVKPKMVYISFPTEFGTLYKKEEIEAISRLCKENGLYLYLDGARLAAGLTAKDNDVNIKDLAKYCDVFYIGGTKNGLLFGEAVVICNDELKDYFRYNIKHYGGMIAKGFVTGIMFEELFSNNLFYEIGKIQNELAYYLTNELLKTGVKLYTKTESNQVFVVFKTEIIKELEKEISFEVWSQDESETVIRFVCHYLHKKEDIDKAIDIIKKIK